MDFSHAVQIVLEREGGLVDIKEDPGGITNFGISLRAYPELGRDGIKNMTKEKAAQIMRKDYWDLGGCEKLPSDIRLAFFDGCVNQGIVGATKTLQKALGVKEDGILGPTTIKAAEKYPVTELCANFLAERAKFYASCKGFDKFGIGWLTRLFLIALAKPI